jgi:hypothetical protein
MGKGRDKRRLKAKRDKATRDKATRRDDRLPRIAEPSRDDSASSNDPDAPVSAPLKPKPHPRSGAIALPEPDDPDDAFAKTEPVRISK